MLHRGDHAGISFSIQAEYITFLCFRAWGFQLLIKTLTFGPYDSQATEASDPIYLFVVCGDVVVVCAHAGVYIICLFSCVYLTFVLVCMLR